jgi:methyl-accepting chemotaxis protein
VSLKDASRQIYSGSPAPTINEINAGSLQRIADAVEKMASNYAQLQNDRDRYKHRAEENAKSAEKLARQNSALRGVITKLKAVCA